MRKTFVNFVALWICATLHQFSCNAYVFGESPVKTLSLISGYGYPAEEHKVTTAYGYNVTLFRIPYSPKYNSSEASTKRSVVFLMHGILKSSSSWVLGGYPRGLAFLLSDAGYDVWMGNARGNRYSHEHVTLKPQNPIYWDFSWHEIGIYDLPANIDYILEQTSSTQLQYIGYSQGTTSFIVATSTLPSFNEKINSAFLLAPAAFIAHSVSKALLDYAALIGYPRPTLFGEYGALPSSALFAKFVDALCRESSPVKGYCSELENYIFGANSQCTNTSALPFYLEITPAGTSTKQIIHYSQLYNSKRFCQFDYGILDNLEVYGQYTPPDYKIEDIKTPIYAYHSENDALAAPQDVEQLLGRMQPNTLKKAYNMPLPSWNHLDFIIANDVDKLLYDIVVEDMQRALENS